MKNRNPSNTVQRPTEANHRRTMKRIETYEGKNDLLRTWEIFASTDAQIREHDYLLGLKKRVRENKNYLLHRADPNADI